MSVRILKGKDGLKCLYCNTTDWAFGPIFYEYEDPEEFLKTLSQDARIYSNSELERKLTNWRLSNKNIIKTCDKCGKVDVDDEHVCSLQREAEQDGFYKD